MRPPAVRRRTRRIPGSARRSNGGSSAASAPAKQRIGAVRRRRVRQPAGRPGIDRQWPRAAMPTNASVARKVARKQGWRRRSGRDEPPRVRSPRCSSRPSPGSRIDLLVFRWVVHARSPCSDRELACRPLRFRVTPPGGLACQERVNRDTADQSIARAWRGAVNDGNRRGVCAVQCRGVGSPAVAARRPGAASGTYCRLRGDQLHDILDLCPVRGGRSWIGAFLSMTWLRKR